LSQPRAFALTCPAPVPHSKTIVLGHGSGGRLSAQLIRDLFLPAFDNPWLRKLDDQAVIDAGKERIAFTTDAFVVTPLFFPGGDIGRLAVNGTINDLAMCGARPLCLSASFIVEEGLEMAELERIVASMAVAAKSADVPIVTGDTKVVSRGSADRLFITTSGIGIVPEGRCFSASAAKPGDSIILSGSIGDHGMAVLSVRENLELESSISSDTAPLHRLVESMAGAGEIHALRDPTRGGLAASLSEIASASGVGVEISARAIPIKENVRAASELLGIDPLFVANEGKLVAFLRSSDVEAVLCAMKSLPEGREATVIGRATEHRKHMVLLKTEIGGTRIVELPFSEQLPRIC
jgi:hydrogenase expression/formation protein HypE